MIKFIGRARGPRHVDVAIRTGEKDGSLALCGNLCMGVEDWRALKLVLDRGRAAIPQKVVIDEPRDEVDA